MTATPLTGAEKDSLHAFLDKQRDVVLWKLEGLGEEDLRRPVVPSGTNLLGLIQHLAAVEYGWFCFPFGRETEPFPFGEWEDGMQVPEEHTADDVLAYYARARSAADAAIADLTLEDTGTAWSGETVSLRWVLLHMIEETARHAGHADVLRELHDGATGR
jgi:uncharacterized damage-inducible protein DinB